MYVLWLCLSLSGSLEHLDVIFCSSAREVEPSLVLVYELLSALLKYRVAEVVLRQGRGNVCQF